MSRILATQEAKTAIQQMKATINGGLTDQISSVEANGQTLSDPNVWDGPSAEQYRNTTWPETGVSLRKVIQDLQELQQQLDTISNNIYSAGGGS